MCLVSFVLVLLLMPTLCTAQQATAENLVLYLPCEDAQNPVDASPDPTTVAVEGTLTTGEGMFGTNGLVFPDWSEIGKQENRLAVATAPKLEGMSALTITAWVLPRNLAAHSGRVGIVSKRLGFGGSDEYNVFVHTGTRVHFRVNANAGMGLWSTTVLEDDNWYHVAATFDRGAVELYINGVLEDSGAHPSSSVVTGDPPAPVWIGVLDGPRTSFGCAGTLDDISIWTAALSEEDIARLMTTGIAKLIAGEVAITPIPADGADELPIDADLGWAPGNFADKHDVYIGTSFDDVNDATATVDPAGVYVGRQSETAVALDRLEYGQTYYWRIDEVNAPPDLTVFKGDVWSFTTELFSYPMPSENITATASSSSSADEGPEKTVDSSGLDANDLHSMLGADMWLSDFEPSGAWIQYEFDKAYKLHEMWVWNSNQMIESDFGLGLKAVTVEYSTDGATWAELADVPEFAQAPGADGYAHNTTVNLGGLAAKYVKLTASSNWAGIVPKYGLSEVRFFFVPVHASEPNPDSGATDVTVADAVLSWRAGREAARHDVYVSTDEQAVIDRTAPMTSETGASHGPLALDIGQTYHWRVVEVNDSETPATWPGDVWSFATEEYFVLDDFEDYNDVDPPDPKSNRIYEAWPDEYLTPTTNGALVGNDVPPYAERSIVHSGSQSMPYLYDTNMKFSEATTTLSSQRRDWTKGGIGSLSLWFRGHPASVGSFTEAPAGTYTMTAAGANIWGAADEFHYAYKTLNGSGSIIAKVESIKNSHSWAKGGVMVRDTLEPGSAHGTMFLTAAQGLAFERRIEAGGNTTRDRQTVITAPYWVKVEVETVQAGVRVRASHSADGIAWTELGDDLLTTNGPVQIGLALTSRTAGLPTEAVFSNVQIDGAVTGDWRSEDIGILSNDPAPMYVALASTGGTPAVVYHSDPDATQARVWKEWNIDLTQFADQGVNLANVESLSIGFGDRDNPQPGGSGKMYFDDIRQHALREPGPDFIDGLAAVTDGLVGYYPLDEGTGNAAVDMSGNGHDGTLANSGVTWIPSGFINGGVNIDGINGSVIELGTWDPTEGTGQLSLAFWINWAHSGNGNQSLISKRTGGWNVDSAMFGLRLRNGNSSFRFHRPGATITTAAGVLNPFVGQWAHVVATFDGTTARIYLNGEEVGSGGFSLGNAIGADMRIGSYNANSPTFNGDIDEVRIYNRALTQAEIVGN